MTSVRRRALIPAVVLGGVLLVSACQPKVSVEAPKEPITINLNVKIEHEVRIKVERELDQLIDERRDLFGGTK